MKNRKSKFSQLLSIQVAKKPSSVILTAIIVINLFFICIAALILSKIAPSYVENRSFFASLFYTITMIMDAGCITFIVEDVGNTNAIVVVVCITTILLGMIFFTGGIIGYVSSQIASFIENSNAGKRALRIADHTVILNWNSRASEIVNDLLYTKKRKTVVVLVNNNRDLVRVEIENRLSETISQENKKAFDNSKKLKNWKRFTYLYKNRLRNRLTVIVRQGDTFSSKQLLDICVDTAKTVIILNQSKGAFYAVEQNQRGNANTIKTLALVAEMTSRENSADNQKIIVEVEDKWTGDLATKIIQHKEKLGKCNISLLPVDKILGQLLSQFSIMPELNLVYSELFSNKDAEFFSIAADSLADADVSGYMEDHFYTVPLAVMHTKSGNNFFYLADSEEDVGRVSNELIEPIDLEMNHSYWQPRRNVIILGHNSRIPSLMNGFDSYRKEWNPARDGRDILNIFVLDTEEGLRQMNYYKEYPYVSSVICADLYDQKTIYDTLNSFIDDQDGDTGILILSDDSTSTEDYDANALTYLIYVQDVLTKRKAQNGGQDTERIDVVVEILNPKNYDVVTSYSVDNVVISNRYISKMVTQIGEKESLFEFYSDILTYDEDDAEEDYVSNELYIKRVGDYFSRIPPKCTVAQLIRSLHSKVKEANNQNLALALGCIKKGQGMMIFSGYQCKQEIELEADDKLILFSNH